MRLVSIYIYDYLCDYLEIILIKNLFVFLLFLYYCYLLLFV